MVFSAENCPWGSSFSLSYNCDSMQLKTVHWSSLLEALSLAFSQCASVSFSLSYLSYICPSLHVHLVSPLVFLQNRYYGEFCFVHVCFAIFYTLKQKKRINFLFSSFRFFLLSWILIRIAVNWSCTSVTWPHSVRSETQSYWKISPRPPPITALTPPPGIRSCTAWRRNRWGLLGAFWVRDEREEKMKCNDISHSCGSKKVFVCVRKRGKKSKSVFYFWEAWRKKSDNI